MSGVTRDDPPEVRRMALMRAATTKAENRRNIQGHEKTGANRPRPVTLVKMPWDEKEKDDGS